MKKILAAIDFSDVSDRVLDTAVASAKAHGAGLVLVHVAAPEPEFIGYEVGPVSERAARAEHLREEHRQLQAMAKRCQAAGVDATALLVPGYPAQQIIQESAEHEASMIVIGSHGHGAVYRLLVGSVSEGVIRHAPCPVLLVPAQGE